MAGAVAGVVVVVVVVSVLVVLMVVLLLWRRKKNNKEKEKAGNGLDLSNPNYDSCEILTITFFCCRRCNITNSPGITVKICLSFAQQKSFFI